MADLAMSLADYSVVPNPLIAGVAKAMSEDSKFLSLVKFETVSSLAIKVAREATALPSSSWRQMGAAHGSVKADRPDVVEETAYSIGNAIVVDKMILADKSPKLYDPFTYQTKQTIRGITRNFANTTINGIPTDVTNPVGLWYRLVNDGDLSAQVIAGAALDISADAAGLTANTQAFIDALDALIYAMTGSMEASGMGILFLTNDTMIKRVNSLFRQSGLLTTSSDALGRVFIEYKGAKFVDMGFKNDDSTRIMGNVEATDGSALTGGGSTSIYGVRLGKEYFTPWQMYPLDVSPLELQADKVTWKSVIDWAIGLAVSSPKGVSRLKGIVAA